MADTKILYIDQGSNFSYSFTATDYNGSYINFNSGYTFGAAHIRRNYTSSTYIPFTVSLSGGQTGQVTISLSATATSQIKPGRYVYDVEIYNGSNTIRVLQGPLFLDAEITK